MRMIYMINLSDTGLSNSLYVPQFEASVFIIPDNVSVIHFLCSSVCIDDIK